jgi:hypothetical protein
VALVEDLHRLPSPQAQRQPLTIVAILTLTHRVPEKELRSAPPVAEKPKRSFTRPSRFSLPLRNEPAQTCPDQLHVPLITHHESLGLLNLD